MPWWDRNNLRLIQTNIRAADAAMDRQALIEKLKDLSANVLLLNTGGLVAFYPTSLNFHYRSPFLGSGDLTGDMVKLCHDNGMRYMARFDFSKIHESIYVQHPEWAYRSLKKDIINYNGMVHACINSEYQRRRSLDILKEVTDKYDIDGVFFNMFGYTTRDYSNTYHGICQCKNCKALFRERYGKDLPTAEDPADPVFRLYQQFREETVHELLDNVKAVIKGKSPELAISTYTDYNVDIIKKESNTEIHRPLPHWEYSASENNQSVEGTWDDKLISNVCINATSIDYRFQGVPAPQVALRLYQAMASGAGMDFCIIGVFADYPDRKSLPVVKDIFSFHKKHEPYFGNFTGISDVLLLKPGPHPSDIQTQEYRGLFKILKQSHIQFRVVEQPFFAKKHIENVQAILCADPALSESTLDVLEFAQAQGKALVWAGTAWAANPGKRFLKLFSVAEHGPLGDGRWAYLLNDPKSLFTSLEDTDWTLLDGPVVPVKGVGACTYGLEKLSPGRFGPPEMCGGNKPTGDYALLRNENSKTMLFAFQPGSLYHRYGYDEYRHIIADALRSGGCFVDSLIVKAPPCVEVFFNRYENNGNASAPQSIPSAPQSIPPALFNIQLINLSGYNGTSFHEPVGLEGLEFKVKLPGNVKLRAVRAIAGNQVLPFYYQDGFLSFTVPRLDAYELIIIE